MIEVVCGAFIYEGKVLIAQRNYGSSQGMFEFPGGKVEPGESKEAALIREFKEECDVDIENVQYLCESQDQQDYAFHLTCFTCTGKEKPTKCLVHSQYVWTTPEHIYDFPFFESDRDLVNQLKEVWPCLLEQMKQKY